MPENAEIVAPGYHHTQKAPLCLIFYCMAVAFFVLAGIVGEPQVILFVGGLGLFMLVLAASFH